MKQYLYRIRPARTAMLSEGSTSFEEEAINAHAVYVKGLIDSGTGALAGRTLNEDDAAFGIVIFRAGSDEAARAVMEADPAVAAGVMTADLFPYRVAFAVDGFAGWIERDAGEKPINRDESLRRHLDELLAGGSAHDSVMSMIRSFPASLAGAQVPGVPHTAWELLEHLRIAQWDILEFSRSADHVSPPHPEGYWPGSDAPKSEIEWIASADRFLADLDEMRALVADRSTDLYTPIAHGTGQTVLREALLTADHNAWHLGQLARIRRALS